MKLKITSKYKTFGVLLLILVNLLWLPVSWLVLTKFIGRLSLENYEWQKIDFGALLFAFIPQVLLLVLSINHCRYIIIDEEKIVFVNPILPFIRSKKYWKDFDYMRTVNEYSRAGYYEAIWLVKNRRLSFRISSFYYSNYEELKARIGVKNDGALDINPIKTLGCLLGMRI